MRVMFRDSRPQRTLATSRRLPRPVVRVIEAARRNSGGVPKDLFPERYADQVLLEGDLLIVFLNPDTTPQDFVSELSLRAAAIARTQLLLLDSATNFTAAAKDRPRFSPGEQDIADLWLNIGREIGGLRAEVQELTAFYREKTPHV